MASVFENFLILFGIDVNPLIKGSADVERETNKMESSFKSAEEAGQKFQTSITGIGKQLVGLGLAYFSLSSVISGLKANLDYTNEIAKTSQYLQVNVEDLDAWRGAILRNGGSIASLETSLSSLNNTLYETSVRGFSANLPYFRALGIHIRDANGKLKDAISLLPQFADKLSRFNYYKAVSIGKLFGIDPQTVSLLRTGSKNIEELIRRQKELGVVTTQQAEIARKYKIQQQDTNLAFRSLYGVLNAEILPVLTKFSATFEHIAEYFTKHSALIAGALIPIAATLGIIATEAIIASLPFYTMVAVILLLGATFAIVFEDIYGYFHGMDSLTGEFLAKFPHIKEALKNLGKIAKVEFEYLIKVGEEFLHILAQIMKLIGKLWSFEFKIIDKVAEKFNNLFDDKKINVNGNIDHMNKLLVQTYNPVLAPQRYSNILSPGTGVNNVNKSTSVSIGEINVQTQATDADQISFAIANSTKKQFEQASSMLDNSRVS